MLRVEHHAWLEAWDLPVFEFPAADRHDLAAGLALLTGEI
jgi:hypothetical protein